MKHDCQCPPEADLARLLVEPDADVTSSDIVEHVGECSGCQERLEKIADSSSRIVELVSHLDDVQPDSNSAYWPALDAVKHLGEAAETPTFVPRTTPRVGKPDDSLDFLEKSDDPAYLGRLGHFDITRLIGRGGMGLVLEAHDAHLHRTVAIKVLDPQLANDELSRQRFCREARSAAAITHDHVVSVYQVERMKDGTLPYLVMQLIQGETLEKKLSREGALPLQDIIRIGMQTAAGLAAAHSQGVIHRDIKPSNILLDETNGRAKLTDFGLARCIEDLGITRTGFVAGTPLYMSPEQALGDKLDERSDLFSLGGVLFEMATGRPPFRGNTPLAVLKQIADRSAPSVRSLNSDLPAWLSDLIQQLLAKRPDQRPISASVVAEEMAKRLSAFEPVSPLQIPAVHTSGACETVMRRHRRHRMLSMVGGTLLGAAIMSAALIPLVGRGPASVTAEPVGAAAIATLKGNVGPIWDLALTSDGTKLAMAIDDGSVKLWDLPEMQLVATMKVHDGVTWATSISADRQYLATGHDDGTIHIWNLDEQKELRALKAEGAVRTLRFAPKGHDLAVGTRTGQLAVWDVDSGDRKTQFEGHKGLISHLEFSHDGEVLGSASSDKTARLWNVKTGKERVAFEKQGGGVYGIAFSADDQLVATAGWGGVVHVWEAASGNAVDSLKGHQADVWGVAFSPTGRLLASVGEDHELRLWDVKDVKSIKQLPRRDGHTGTLYTVRFTPQGKMVTAGRDGTAKIWNVNAEIEATK